mgnify:CR=1 FL=1
MNPELAAFLEKASAVMRGDPMPSDRPFLYSGPSEKKGGAVNRNPFLHSDAEERSGFRKGPSPRLHVGVDLGTAYTVLAVLDEQMQPLAGEYRFAQVVRDGLVIDYHGAIQLIRALKQNVEKRLGLTLTSAATAFPPGVSPNEIGRAHV